MAVLVDFLTDEQASVYARFVGAPSRTELERFSFLDDADRSVVDKRSGDANRLGFGVQRGTVRQLGTFLPDPVDVPTQVVDYVAGQLENGDPSCLKTYAGRAKTRLEHQWEIARLYGYREPSTWIGDRTWTTGEGPEGAVRRGRRLAAGAAGAASRRERRHQVGRRRAGGDHTAALGHAGREGRPGPGAPPGRAPGGAAGARLSDLERLRHGPTSVSGKAMAEALARVGEVGGVGLAGVAIDDVPQRRLVELARCGMAAKAPALRRHPHKRRPATLLATTTYLEAKAVTTR